MTSRQLHQWQDQQFLRDASGRKLGERQLHDPLGFCLSEIALQLALLNEHNARMEARYMSLTAVAVKKKSGVGARHGVPVQKPVPNSKKIAKHKDIS